jgi:AcrR family transcriptional regulator
MPKHTKNLKRRLADPSASAGKRSSAQTIIEAAERLCATHGIEAVSVRDIAAEAGVAIAVIYHHYQSKGNLLRTIFRARFDEVKDEYESLLTQLEGQKSPAVQDIVRALLQPLNHWRGPEGQAARQFYILALISQIPELRNDIDVWVVGLRRVVDLLRRALPHLKEADICWRLHFTMKLRHQSDLDMARLSIVSKGLCRSDDREETLVRAVAYAQAAFSGPPLDYPPSGEPGVRRRAPARRRTR